MMETIQDAIRSILGLRYHGYPVGAGGTALLLLLVLARLFQPKAKKGGTVQSRRNLMKIHPHLDPEVRRKHASEVAPLLRREASSAGKPSVPAPPEESRGAGRSEPSVSETVSRR